MSDYNNILVIQTAFLGDAILTTSLVRALKQTYPDAKIDILTIPGTSIVFKFNPHINNTLVFDKRNSSKKYLSFISLCIKLRAKHYDLAVSAHLSWSSSLLMFLSGIPNRLGFPRQKLLTMTIELPKGIPIAKRYLRLMTVLTDQEFSSQTELFWDEKTDVCVDKLVKDYITSDEKVIGIAPGSIWNTKRWLPEYFSSLISMLDKYKIKCILIGGNDDIDLCNTISTNSGVTPLNLAGKLSILGSAALIKRLRLLVTNDSAPLHLANAVETDVIAIFGPTVKRFGFFPFRESDKVLEIELECRPCGKHGGNSCPQTHFRCMKAITPDMVLKEILTKLEQN